MKHDPERSAAAFLAGELSPDELQYFEEHLMGCDECWTEVDAGRRGLRAVESVRELAPSHLRSAVRRSITSAPNASPTRDRRRLIAAVATVVVVSGAAAGALVTRGPVEPPVIAAAVAAYTDDRLPGSDMPKSPPPDLSSLRMTEMGAGAGRIDDMPITAYAYRDHGGRRLVVYVSTTTFPMPGTADMLDGSPEGPWMAHSDGVTVLAARHPHQLLIVGEDEALVHDAAVVLDVM